MPLYEIVLCAPDGGQEVRITDRPTAVGDRIVVANREWDVVLERKPDDVRATARYLCELTKEQRRRARAAQAKNAELLARMEGMTRSGSG